MTGIGHFSFGAEEIVLTQHILLGLEKVVVRAKIAEPGICVGCRGDPVKSGDHSMGHWPDCGLWGKTQDLHISRWPETTVNIVGSASGSGGERSQFEAGAGTVSQAWSLPWGMHPDLARSKQREEWEKDQSGTSHEDRGHKFHSTILNIKSKRRYYCSIWLSRSEHSRELHH